MNDVVLPGDNQENCTDHSDETQRRSQNWNVDTPWVAYLESMIQQFCQHPSCSNNTVCNIMNFGLRISIALSLLKGYLLSATNTESKTFLLRSLCFFGVFRRRL